MLERSMPTGVGKTTLARKIAHEDKAVRFSPDEWMIPLFGTTWREPDADGKRDVLEGRLLWARTRCSASVAR